MEKEKAGCLPFLDLLMKRSPSGHLFSAVYRKSTHSDRYFNVWILIYLDWRCRINNINACWVLLLVHRQYLNTPNLRSEHPIQHKQSVVNTLLERAKKLSSTTQDLNSELKYVKRTLLFNGYPKWMIRTKRRNSTTDRLSLDLKSFHLAQQTWERLWNGFWRDIEYKPFSNL